MNTELPKPGWCGAAGDSPNDLRYWDGEMWIGGPVEPPPSASARATGSPAASSGSQDPSRQAVTALLVGIGGLLLCQLASPVAWKLGRDHLKLVNAGIASAGDRNLAVIGMILGMVGTAVLVVAAVVIGNLLI